MSCNVILVTIGITAEEMWSIRIFETDLFNMISKVNKRGHELVLLTRGREVEGCVDRGDCSWYLHEN